MLIFLKVIDKNICKNPTVQSWPPAIQKVSLCKFEL